MSVLAAAAAALVGLTLMGLGDGAGNGAGILFWTLLALFGAVATALVYRGNDEGAGGYARRITARERR